MRIEIKKNREKGSYELRMYIGQLVFEHENIPTKEIAQDYLDGIKKEIDRSKISKLRATLTDVEISKFSFEIYPVSVRGFFENMLRDMLRKEFIRTAKFIRTRFLEINLNFEEDKDEQSIQL